MASTKKIFASIALLALVVVSALAFGDVNQQQKQPKQEQRKQQQFMESFGEAQMFGQKYAKGVEGCLDGAAAANYAAKPSPAAPSRESAPSAAGFCPRPADAIRLHNWGGNVVFSTQNIQYPRTVAQVQQIVRSARKLRVLGSRHSFNQIADSQETILSTLGLNSIVSFNTSVPSVTVQGGVTYSDLAPAIFANGFALPNLAAIAELSVVGAGQTGAHGSGMGLPSLSTHIRSMQLVLANGTVANYGPGSRELKALACGLGVFGVITQVELNLVPNYNTISYVFENMPTENLYSNFDAIQQMGYNVNAVTFMVNTSVWNQITIIARTGTPQNAKVANMTSLFGATRSFAVSSPFIVEINKEQPWYQGLLNFRLGTSGTDGNEIQTEYFVPYANAVPAMRAMEKLIPTIRSLAVVHLIRTIAGDDLMLSEYNGAGPKVAIHFSWQNNMTALAPLLAKVEAALVPFGARPHWGKYFTMCPSKFLKQSYPKLEEFKNLAKKLDPNGKFRNKFVDDNVFVKLC